MGLLRTAITEDAALFVDSDEHGETTDYVNVDKDTGLGVLVEDIPVLVDNDIDANTGALIETSATAMIRPADLEAAQPGLTPASGDQLQLRGFLWHIGEVDHEEDVGTYILSITRGAAL